jgi:hypothetical protein
MNENLKVLAQIFFLIFQQNHFIKVIIFSPLNNIPFLYTHIFHLYHPEYFLYV